MSLEYQVATTQGLPLLYDRYVGGKRFSLWKGNADPSDFTHAPANTDAAYWTKMITRRNSSDDRYGFGFKYPSMDELVVGHTSPPPVSRVITANGGVSYPNYNSLNTDPEGLTPHDFYVASNIGSERHQWMITGLTERGLSINDFATKVYTVPGLDTSGDPRLSINIGDCTLVVWSHLSGTSYFFVDCIGIFNLFNEGSIPPLSSTRYYLGKGTVKFSAMYAGGTNDVTSLDDANRDTILDASFISNFGFIPTGFRNGVIYGGHCFGLVQEHDYTLTASEANIMIDTSVIETGLRAYADECNEVISAEGETEIAKLGDAATLLLTIRKTLTQGPNDVTVGHSLLGPAKEGGDVYSEVIEYASEYDHLDKNWLVRDAVNVIKKLNVQYWAKTDRRALALPQGARITLVEPADSDGKYFAIKKLDGTWIIPDRIGEDDAANMRRRGATFNPTAAMIDLADYPDPDSIDTAGITSSIEYISAVSPDDSIWSEKAFADKADDWFSCYGSSNSKELISFVLTYISGEYPVDLPSAEFGPGI